MVLGRDASHDGVQLGAGCSPYDQSGTNGSLPTGSVRFGVNSLARFFSHKPFPLLYLTCLQTPRGAE